MTDISKISIITVAYQSAGPLVKMLKTIPDGPEVIVVDNGEDDGFRAMAAELGVKLILADRNLGFGAACNLGAKAATRDFFLFLNPDTQCYPDTLEQFLKAVDRYPEAAAFGASFEDEDGWVRYTRFNSLAPYELPTPKANPEVDTEVRMLMGAGILVPQSAFEKVNGFDPEIFLYHEDDDISLRLRQQVGPIIYVPNARIVHVAGNSSEDPESLVWFKGYHWQKSHIYALRKHGVKLARTRVILFALQSLMTIGAIRNQSWRIFLTAQLFGALGLLRPK